jgi:putative NIF3 family GTP cyclohydrolase 1 type 2
MKLGDIQKLAETLGLKNDLRSPAQVKRYLQEHKNDVPYSDSIVNYGDPDTKVGRILAGIDMQTPEILLADRLGNIDLIISHHSEGKALAELHKVMHMQSSILEQYGVPGHIAEGIMQERIDQVVRKLHKTNHYRSTDAAKLLGMPFMSAHTICDNMAATWMKKFLSKEKPQTVGEAIKALNTIPEFKKGQEQGAGPMLTVGATKNRLGKAAITGFTGGTEGSKAALEHLSHAGVSTIIAMHMSEEHRKEAAIHHLNVIITGHMASDSLGMNLFLDELEKKGVEVIPASGLIRVSRNKTKAKRK